MSTLVRAKLFLNGVATKSRSTAAQAIENHRNKQYDDDDGDDDRNTHSVYLILFTSSPYNHFNIIKCRKKERRTNEMLVLRTIFYTVPKPKRKMNVDCSQRAVYGRLYENIHDVPTASHRFVLLRHIAQHERVADSHCRVSEMGRVEKRARINPSRITSTVYFFASLVHIAFYCVPCQCCV